MKSVEHWKWWVPHDVKPGKLVKTAWKMDCTTAQRRWPGCEPVAGSMELRQMAETDTEKADAMYRAGFRPSGGDVGTSD